MKIEQEIGALATETSRQWPQILAVMSAALLAVGSGFQMGWPSPSVLKMLSNDLGFKISELEVSYVVTIAPLGYLIGSPLSGFLLDKIGRKYTLLLLSIPQIIAWTLIATSTCVPMLYVARLFTGIADGALFTTLPIYICEILEPKVRGVVGTSHTMGILIGVLLINSYGSYVSIRTAAYISVSVPILFLVTFVWMPDSPYYQLVKGHTEAASKSLKNLRRMRNVDVELSNISSDVQRQISEPGRIKDVFTIRTNLKAFLILLGLRTFQQFSGITALAFYTQVIFKQAGGWLSPAESAIVCSAIQVLFTCCSSGLVDKFGRKPLLLFSSSGTATILMVLGLYFCFQQYGYDMSSFKWLPVLGMVLYNVICAIGLLMVPNLMAGELLSVSVKSKAMGIINMYLGLCMSASSKLFQYLEYNFGMHVPFFVFGLCCIVSTVFCYCGVPETKAKTLEQIQQILKGHHGANLSNTKEKDVISNSTSKC